MFLSANYRLFVSHMQSGQLLDCLQSLEKQAKHSGGSGHEDCLRSIESLRSSYHALLEFKVNNLSNEHSREITAGFWKTSYSVFLKLNSVEPRTRDGADLLDQARERLESETQQLSFYSLSGEPNVELLRKTHKEIENTELQIFQYICPPSAIQTVLHPEWTDREKQSIETILNSNLIDSDSKELFRVAIMLSCMHAFDFRKLQCLNDAVGLAFTLYVHRFLFNTLQQDYPSLVPKSLPKFETDTLKFLQLQLLQYEHNLHLQGQIQDDLLNNGLKHAANINIQTLEDLLDPESDVFGEVTEQAQFAETLKDNMHKMVELQEAHSDSYYNSFKNLKHFPFFNDAANWFRAFDSHNSQVTDILSLEKGNIARAIWKRGEMCDSDLYSLLFMLESVPGKRPAGPELDFPGFTSSDEEEEEEQTRDIMEKMRTDTLHRLWEFYRFFNLYKGQENPFPHGLNDYLRGAAKTDGGQVLLGRIDYFSDCLNHPSAALDLARKVQDIAPKAALAQIELALRHVGAQTDEKEGEILLSDILRLKAGLLARLGCPNEAIEVFEHLSIVGDLSPKETETFAKCLQQIGQAAQSQELYAQLIKQYPNSPRYLRLLSLSLIKAGRYTDALQQLLTAESLQEGDDTSLERAIAWCLLCLGKVEQACTHYDHLLDLHPAPLDWLNSAHAALAKGDWTLAALRYKEYRQLTKPDEPLTIKPSDISMLQDTYGIHPHDVQQLIDYVNWN